MSAHVRKYQKVMLKNPDLLSQIRILVVEVTGFEPATFWSRTKRATKLRYTSTGKEKAGANKGTRTLDLRFTKPLLYQLSYIGASAFDIIPNGKLFVQHFPKKVCEGRARRFRSRGGGGAPGCPAGRGSGWPVPSGAVCAPAAPDAGQAAGAQAARKPG